MPVRKAYPTDVSDEEWSFFSAPPTLRSVALAARFRRLARDYERLPAMVAGPPFVCLFPHRAIAVLELSP